MSCSLNGVCTTSPSPTCSQPCNYTVNLPKCYICYPKKESACDFTLEDYSYYGGIERFKIIVEKYRDCMGRCPKDKDELKLYYDQIIDKFLGTGTQHDPNYFDCTDMRGGGCSWQVAPTPWSGYYAS